MSDDPKAKVVSGSTTVASSQEPDVAATPQGVVLRMRGRDGQPVVVSLSARLLRNAVALWTWETMALAVSGPSGVSLIDRAGATVTSFARLPPHRQRSLAALVQGYHELLAAGHPNVDAEANAALERWLADDGSDESEIAKVNELRAALGLADAG